MLRPRSLLLVWVLLAGATLALTVFETKYTASLQGEGVTLADGVPGWLWLVFGVGDPLGGRFAWLAHPVGLAALGLASARRSKAALALCVASLAFAGTTFSYVGATWKLGPGGAAEEITGLGLGYWTWLVALAIPALLALVHLRLSRSPQTVSANPL